MIPKNIYIDTNIFIYLATPNSPYHELSHKSVSLCLNNKTDIFTSTETVQEIVHVMKINGQQDKGIFIAKNIIKLVTRLISVDTEIILQYLELLSIYKKPQSRDVLHVATCIKNKISTIMTYDKHFSEFKEIQILKPEDVIRL